MRLVDDFVRNAEAVGVKVHRGAAPSLEGAGVSRALFGLADTGSVVLAASPDEPRARSLSRRESAPKHRGQGASRDESTRSRAVLRRAR